MTQIESTGPWITSSHNSIIIKLGEIYHQKSLQWALDHQVRVVSKQNFTCHKDMSHKLAILKGTEWRSNKIMNKSHTTIPQLGARKEA